MQGDRFGGALDGAARQFSEAFDKGWSPMQFVNEQRRLGSLIMGIGHKVKSINNPDKRVEILKSFALDRTRFQQETPLLDYALKVEKITTAKVSEQLTSFIFLECRNRISFSTWTARSA